MKPYRSVSSRNLHQQLIFRIGLTAFLAGMLTSAFLWFYGIEQFEEDAVESAQVLAEQMIATHVSELSLLERGGRLAEADRQQLLQVANEYVTRYFSFVELYDVEGEEVVAATSSDPLAKSAVEARAHMNPKNEHIYNAFYDHDKLYIQIFLPLKKEKEIFGYVEMVYTYPELFLKQQYRHLIEAMLAVMLSVLVAAAVIYPVVMSLFKETQARKLEILQGNMEMLELIGSAISKRDSDTDEHNFRVTLYALALAERMGISKERCRELIKGAFVHDIGKIAISDNILLKPGKLTDEEFAVMQSHVKEGADIVRVSTWLNSAKDIVEFHHEKYNGKGYPHALKGEEIPLNARIFAIADVFDALTSKRPYKEPFSVAASLQILREEAGQHFDPNLVECFIDIADALHAEFASLPRQALAERLHQTIRTYFF